LVKAEELRNSLYIYIRGPYMNRNGGNNLSILVVVVVIVVVIIIITSSSLFLSPVTGLFFLVLLLNQW
jgi:hypothetical protein